MDSFALNYASKALALNPKNKYARYLSIMLSE